MREKLKKSESLEIRIPFPTKQAFMARCRAEGRSASEALREMIEGRLQPAPPRLRWRRLVAGLLAAGMAAVAVPSLARTPHGEFGRLDVDGDGRITTAEFHAFDADRDGAVTARELGVRGSGAGTSAED